MLLFSSYAILHHLLIFLNYELKPDTDHKTRNKKHLYFLHRQSSIAKKNSIIFFISVAFFMT